MPPLAPHVHLAIVGEDIVLLDVRADAYHCVPDGAPLLRPSADGASVSPAIEEVTEALSAAGMLADTPMPRQALARPTRDLAASASNQARPRDLLRLAGAFLDLQLHYRRRGMTTILDHVRRAAPCPADAANEAEMNRLAGIFGRWAPWLPMERKCLARSFVLLRFLQRSGVNARWVFGVRTWPFGAHCWLQWRDVALDDSAERLAVFEPIMAVG